MNRSLYCVALLNRWSVSIYFELYTIDIIVVSAQCHGSRERNSCWRMSGIYVTFVMRDFLFMADHSWVFVAADAMNRRHLQTIWHLWRAGWEYNNIIMIRRKLAVVLNYIYLLVIAIIKGHMSLLLRSMLLRVYSRKQLCVCSCVHACIGFDKTCYWSLGRFLHSASVRPFPYNPRSSVNLAV
jgi:hypothetical protein